MHKRLSSAFSHKLKFLFTLLISISALMLVGCASNESVALVGEYAKQSAQLQATLVDVFEEANTARINAEIAKATRDGATSKDLDIPTINHSGQKALLKSLQDFSQSIYSLATDDRGNELDKYSEKLNSSLLSLSAELDQEGIDAKNIELLSTSVNAITRTYTERERYKLLKKVVIDSQPIIQSSFKSLKDELNSWKTVTKVSLEKELRIRLSLLNFPNRCAQSDDTRCVTFHHSLEERIDAYQKAFELKSRLNNLDAHFTQIESSLEAIQSLSVALVQSLERDDELSKETALKALNSTKVQIESLKDFRAKLKD
ncbi:hypothetical protein ACU6DI_001027 [Vibrio navarrensis]